MPEFQRLMQELQFMQILPSRLNANEAYCFTIDGKTEISFLQQQSARAASPGNQGWQGDVTQLAVMAPGVGELVRANPL